MPHQYLIYYLYTLSRLKKRVFIRRREIDNLLQQRENMNIGHIENCTSWRGEGRVFWRTGNMLVLRSRENRFVKSSGACVF